MHEVNFHRPMMLFHIIVIICSLIFIAGVFINLKIIFSGRKNIDSTKTISTIINSIIFDSLLQIPLIKLSPFRWLTHMLIFWGFTGLFVGTTRLFIYTDIIRSDWVVYGQDIACDISGIMLLTGILFATARRIFVRNNYILNEFEDGIMLALLFVLGVSGFLTEGARIALTPGGVNEASFVGIWLAGLMEGISSRSGTVIWTVHALSSALFIAYIPFSKMWHAFTAPAVLAANPVKLQGGAKNEKN